MQISISKKNIRDLLEYIFIAILILDCRTIWQRLINTPSWFNIVLWIILIGTIISYLIIDKNFDSKFFNKSLMYIFTGIIYSIIFIIVNPLNIANFIKLSMAITSISIFIMYYKQNNIENNILKKYQNIILVIAGVSIFFWLFGSVLNIIPNTGYVYTTWETVFSPKVPTYYYVYYSTQRADIFGQYILRNTAIFTEAPMASLQFCFAFLIEFFMEKDKKIWKIILLICAIVTTFSFTGYIVITMSFLLKWIFNKQYKHWFYIVVKIIALPLIAIVVITFVTGLFNTRMEGESGQARSRDFIEGFQLWKNHILFGYGYKSIAVENVGFSNSIIPILTQGGLYSALFYILLILKTYIKCILKKDKNLFLFQTIFMFLFVTTNIPFQYLTLFIIIYNTNTDKVYSNKNLYYFLKKANISVKRKL